MASGSVRASVTVSECDGECECEGECDLIPSSAFISGDTNCLVPLHVPLYTLPVAVCVVCGDVMDPVDGWMRSSCIPSTSSFTRPKSQMTTDVPWNTPRVCDHFSNTLDGLISKCPIPCLCRCMTPCVNAVSTASSPSRHSVCARFKYLLKDSSYIRDTDHPLCNTCSRRTCRCSGILDTRFVPSDS